MSGDGIGDAPATIPVALLPVRLETRYDDGDLLVRIYPDRWHQFSHQDALTKDEANAGQAFWAVSGDRLPYWTALCTRFSTPRATWIVRATNPAGPAPDTSRTTSWDMPVTARGLPDRWVAAGYTTGNPSPVVVVQGSDITDGLAIGPTPTKPPKEASEDGAEPQAEKEDDGEPGHVDPGMAWLVGFAQAVNAGMALRIPALPPLDRLVVVGITASPNGTAGAQMLTTLLNGHKYTDGMSLLPQGTATNASRPADPQDDEASMATAVSPIPAADPASDGARLCAALGVEPAVLADIDGAVGYENADAQAANAVFWHAGWGHLLGSMLGPPLTDPARDAAWLQFTAFVRARGPLAALRLGDQPFGVLPVQPQDLGTEAPGEDPHIIVLGKMLAGLQPAWMAAGARRLQDDVADRVKRTPRPRSYYGRGAWQPAASASLGWFENITHFIGLPRDEIIDIGDPAGHQSADTLALTQVQQTAGLLGQAVTWAAPRVLLPGAPAPADPATALLIAGQGAILPSVPPDDVLAAQVPWLLTASAASLRADLAGLAGPDSLVRILIRFSLLRALELGGGTVPSPVPAMPLRGRLDGQPDPAADPLGEAYSGVQALGSVTSGQLDLLVAESLELTSTGWHAWVTSLATRRLAQSRAAGGSGIILGGYGVVDNPAPGAGSASQGFVQAPSVAQAATAAILHSAQLTHSDGSNGPLSPMTVDLTSWRVRRGQGLLDGVRAGQPIGALLGYQLERDLQASRGDYIAPFRALAPLDPPASTGDPRAVSAVATDVTDGLALSRLRHGTSGIPWNTTVGGYLLGPEIPDVTSALDDIDETLDAASDILLAESVHSALNGSPGHAAATLDTASQGALVPPPPRFIRTQRTGIDITHRIMCLAPGTGEGTWPQTASTADAPALAAWLATVLGSPDTTDVALQPADPATGADLAAGPVTVPLAALGLGPLDMLRLSGQQGELNSYLRWWAARNPDQVTGLPAGATVRPLLSGAPAPATGHRTLSAVLAAAQAAASMLGQARGMDGRDLDLPGSTDPAADLGELTGRVIAARARLQTIAADLPAATADTLQQAWLAGLPGAVSAAPESAEQIAALAPAVSEQVAARLARAAAVPDPGADAPAAAQLATLTATLQALRGDQLPVLAALIPPQPGIGQLAVQATDVSAADPGQAPAAWLARIARVSEPAAALETVCACSEVLGTACPLSVQVGQLPLPDKQATQPWIGLPLTAQAPADRAALAPRVSLAFVGQPPQAAPARLAGLVVDEWAETIPSTAETAGLSFHYNTPRAQAPQAVLLVTPTGLPQATWALDDLAGAVSRAIDLAQARLAERADLPAAPLLPAAYLDGTGPDTSSPADGIPAARLAPMAAGIADQDGAPVIAPVTGKLTQGASSPLAITGSSLGGSYAFDPPGLGITIISNTATAATLQVSVPPDAPATVQLTATTQLGQSPSVPVTVDPLPRLTGIVTTQPLAQAEIAWTPTIEVTGQGITTATSPAITTASGSNLGLSPAISGVVINDPYNVTITLKVTVPGSPRPPSDWDPGQPGSPLKPPPPPVSSHQEVPLILTITAEPESNASPAKPVSLSTAGLSPGLTLNALIWTEKS